VTLLRQQPTLLGNTGEASARAPVEGGGARPASPSSIPASIMHRLALHALRAHPLLRPGRRAAAAAAAALPPRERAPSFPTHRDPAPNPKQPQPPPPPQPQTLRTKLAALGGLLGCDARRAAAYARRVPALLVLSTDNLRAKLRDLERVRMA
jgi:hypothetical protein